MFIYTLSRIAWSIESIVLCYYYVYFGSTITCVAGIVVISCCVGIILGIGLSILYRPIAVNIVLTGNETYATHCMAKMTECIEVGLHGV